MKRRASTKRAAKQRRQKLAKTTPEATNFQRHLDRWPILKAADQRQVLVNVPGHFWDSIPRADKEKLFLCKVYSFDLAHQFKGSRKGPIEAVNMREVINEAKDMEGFWINMKTFSEFKYKYGPKEPEVVEEPPSEAEAEEVAELSDTPDKDASVEGQPQLREGRSVSSPFWKYFAKTGIKGVWLPGSGKRAGQTWQEWKCKHPDTAGCKWMTKLTGNESRYEEALSLIDLS